MKSDEGFYQCIAENDAGNAQAGAQLIILEHGKKGRNSKMKGADCVFEELVPITVPVTPGYLFVKSNIWHN